MAQKQANIAVTMGMGIVLGLVVLAGLFVGWQLLNRKTESTLEASALDAMPEDVRQAVLTTFTQMVEFDDPRGIVSHVTIKNVKPAPNPSALDYPGAWCFDVETGTSLNTWYVAMYQGEWTVLGAQPQKIKEAGC